MERGNTVADTDTVGYTATSIATSEHLSHAANMHAVDDGNDPVKMTTMDHPSTLCIGQLAPLFGSAVDLSAPDVAQAVASTALLAKAVHIFQPAQCSSGSSINLSDPDAVLAVAICVAVKACFHSPASTTLLRFCH